MPSPFDGESEGVVSQQDFSDALTRPENPVPAGIKGPAGKKAVRRFNVYRNNVTVGLVNALADVFPAVRRIVGDRFFRDMARAYCHREPPRSPLLFLYGSTFPAFIETFEPASHLAYLPDVARIELAWLRAFHAADAAVLDPSELAAVPPGQMAGLRFEPHPASGIVRSSHAAVSICSLTRAGSSLEGIDSGSAEDGLVTRPRFDIQLRPLPPGAAVFLYGLTQGETLGEAAGSAMQEASDFDLAAAISAMLEAGVFTSLRGSRQEGEDQ